MECILSSGFGWKKSADHHGQRVRARVVRPVDRLHAVKPTATSAGREAVANRPLDHLGPWVQACCPQPILPEARRASTPSRQGARANADHPKSDLCEGGTVGGNELNGFARTGRSTGGRRERMEVGAGRG